jgi:hypothetical protein
MSLLASFFVSLWAVLFFIFLLLYQTHCLFHRTGLLNEKLVNYLRLETSGRHCYIDPGILPFKAYWLRAPTGLKLKTDILLFCIYLRTNSDFCPININ